MLRSIYAVAFFAALLGAIALPARSDTTGTWMGTVKYINNTHIGVSAQAQTKDFLLASDTSVYSSAGQKMGRDQIQPGMTVRITYSRSGAFAITRATRIDVGGLSWPLPKPTTQR